MKDINDDKALEALISGQITPPEMDNYGEDEDQRALLSIYESGSIAILEEVGEEDFYYVYTNLKSDITDMPLPLQSRFIIKYLEKMEDRYEYIFEPKPKNFTELSIEDMFSFIEFVEYDNIHFVSYVWKYLDDIITVDIEKYVIDNGDTIVEEITNQSNLMVTLTENISQFLRTYNKDGLLEWFVNHSMRNKLQIFSNNLD